jgi:hypothetical protein
LEDGFVALKGNVDESLIVEESPLQKGRLRPVGRGDPIEHSQSIIRAFSENSQSIPPPDWEELSLNVWRRDVLEIDRDWHGFFLPCQNDSE